STPPSLISSLPLHDSLPISTTAVRSSTAVTQTRRPSSTSASKSGRISSSSSIATASSRTSSSRAFDRAAAPRLRFDSMLISQIPDRNQSQTQYEPGNQVCGNDPEHLPSLGAQ